MSISLYNKYHAIALLTIPIYLPFVFVYQTGVKIVDTIIGTEYSKNQLFWGKPYKRYNCKTCKGLDTCTTCNDIINKEIIMIKEKQDKEKLLENIRKYGNPINCKKCGKEIFSNQLFYTKNGEQECDLCDAPDVTLSHQ